MPQYGHYNPTNPENVSSLFAYREVPVASAKLNRWNGNLSAGLDLLHRVCSALFGRNQPGVITIDGRDALQVIPSATPDRMVQVLTGWALIQNSFAGLLEIHVLPAGGEFVAPANHPRIDLIVLTGNGALEIIDGVESETPSSPDPPADAIELASIYHRVGATQILSEDNGIQSYIIDRRPRLLLGEAHRHNSDSAPSQNPDGIRTQFFTQQVYRSGTLDVFLNGVLQQKSVDYTDDENRLGYTFRQPPLSHYKIQHRYIVEYEVE